MLGFAYYYYNLYLFILYYIIHMVHFCFILLSWDPVGMFGSGMSLFSSLLLFLSSP